MKIVAKNFKNFSCTIIAVVLGIAFLSACSGGNENSYESDDAYFKGDPTANIHDYSVKGVPLFLTAGGITNATANQISFTWTVTGTKTQNFWGQTIKYTPPVENTTVSFTISANAYEIYGSGTTKKTTIVIDSTFEKAVQVPAGISTASTFTDDRDNQTYQYQTIGSNDWMVQNLNWAGTDAANIIGKAYKNESEYSILYGRLYTWEEAASTSKPVCPQGWHLPTNAEWEDLGEALSGVAVTFDTDWEKAGGNATAEATVNGKKMWIYDPGNTRANTEGWNALPAGKVVANGNSVISNDCGQYGYWWSATDYNASTAYGRYIIYNKSIFYYTRGDKKGQYLSVRCVRD